MAKSDVDSMAPSTVAIENPFRELFGDAKKFEDLFKLLSKDYNEIVTLSINLSQECEKFRKEAETFKIKNKELVTINDTLKSKFDYTEARLQLAKKWIQQEYDLREEVENQLQTSELERDQLRQIVQLCKELMLEDDESDGAGSVRTAGKSGLSKRFSEAFMPQLLGQDRERERDDRNKYYSGRSQNAESNLHNVSDAGSSKSDACSEKMNTLIEKLGNFNMESHVDLQKTNHAKIQKIREKDQSALNFTASQSFDVTGELIDDVLSPNKARKEKNRRRSRYLNQKNAQNGQNSQHLQVIGENSRGPRREYTSQHQERSRYKQRQNPIAPFPSTGCGAFKEGCSADWLKMVDGPDQSASFNVLTSPTHQTGILNDSKLDLLQAPNALENFYNDMDNSYHLSSQIKNLKSKPTHSSRRRISQEFKQQSKKKWQKSKNEAINFFFEDEDDHIIKEQATKEAEEAASGTYCVTDGASATDSRGSGLTLNERFSQRKTLPMKYEITNKNTKFEDDTETLTGKSISQENLHNTSSAYNLIQSKNHFYEESSTVKFRAETVPRRQKEKEEIKVATPTLLRKQILKSTTTATTTTSSDKAANKKERRRSIFKKLVVGSSPRTPSKTPFSVRNLNEKLPLSEFTEIVNLPGASGPSLGIGKTKTEEIHAELAEFEDQNNNNSRKKVPHKSQLQTSHSSGAIVTVPACIRAAIFELHRRRAIIDTQVYRNPGNKIKVKDLKNQLLATSLNYEQCRRTIVKVRDSTVITSFVKHFFNACLNEPLLTFSGLNGIVNVITEPEKKIPGREGTRRYASQQPAMSFSVGMSNQEKHQKIISILEQLPKCNIETLSLVMLHMKAIIKNFKSNNMSIDCLASHVSTQIVGYRMARVDPCELTKAKQYQPRIFDILASHITDDFYLKFYNDPTLLQSSITTQTSNCSVLERFGNALKF